MIGDSLNNPFTCEDAYRAIQKRFDGAVDRQSDRLLTAHLDACDDCRAYAESLESVRGAMESLPEVPFPDHALEAVWDRTIRAEGRKEGHLRRLVPIRSLALAAVVALSVIGSRFFVKPTEPSLSPEELARLAAETRLVFELTNTALRHVEDAAIDGVIVEGLTPALKRIQVNWLQTTEEQTGRTGT